MGGGELPQREGIRWEEMRRDPCWGGYAVVWWLKRKGLWVWGCGAFPKSGDWPHAGRPRCIRVERQWRSMCRWGIPFRRVQ